MKRKINLYLEDIIESIKLIEEYTSGVEIDEFLKDKKLQDAVLRRLEIIGEAAKNIPDFEREKNKKIPWQQMAGLRDILIHSYFGVSNERVWKVIKEDLQKLKEDIEKIR